MPELLTLGVDAFPLADQAFQILDDGVFGSALGCGTDDHAHILRRDLRHDVLQTAALTFAQLAAHAGHAAGRHQHQETTRQRDLRGQTGALVPDRVLGDLHEHRIAALERKFDAPRLAFKTRGIPVHLAGIQHAVTSLADVDERGLHARQHVLHTAEIDIADRLHFLDIGHVMLDEHVVFHHGDLGVLLLFTHHHETLDVLAACKEILLHDLGLAAALTAVVAAALLLRLKTRGAFHIGDLVDVLLLARTAGQWLIVFGALLGLVAATATATGNGLTFIRIMLTVGTGLMLVALITGITPVTFGTGFVGTLLGLAATATATASGTRLLFGALLLVDRTIADVIELEVLLDLLDFGGGATLLRVQPAIAATTRRRRLTLVIRTPVTAALITFIVTPATAFTRFVNITGLAIVTGLAAVTAATASGTLFAILTIFAAAAIVEIATAIARGAACRNHRLLEQQRRHRTRRMRACCMRRGGKQLFGDLAGARIHVGVRRGGRTTASEQSAFLTGRGRRRFVADMTAATASRLLFGGLATRRRSDLRLFEQRCRMILHLKFERSSSGTGVTNDAAASTTTTGSGYGRFGMLSLGFSELTLIHNGHNAPCRRAASRRLSGPAGLSHHALTVAAHQLLLTGQFQSKSVCPVADTGACTGTRSKCKGINAIWHVGGLQNHHSPVCHN